jgi:hypothetical protein
MENTTQRTRGVDGSPPQNSVPNLRLRKATFNDISAIARVWADAFFDDEIIGQIMHPYRQQYPEEVYWFLLRGNREHFWTWRHQFVVVTVANEDSNGEKIVGAADWRRLGKGGEARELSWIDPSKSRPAQ